MRALIAGSTGLVGGHLLRALVHSKSVESVAALTRRSLPFSDAKLQSVIVDFDHLEAAPIPPADAVFCCLGTTIRKAGSKEAFRKVDLEYPLALAGAALANGTKQYLLVSSVGAESGSANFYLRTKGELEESIAPLGYRALHVFRPSFLMGDRAESRTGEKIGIAFGRAVGPFLKGPLTKYRAIEAREVAQAMLAASLNKAVSGKHIYEYAAIRDLAGRS